MRLTWHSSVNTSRERRPPDDNQNDDDPQPGSTPTGARTPPVGDGAMVTARCVRAPHPLPQARRRSQLAGPHRPRRPRRLHRGRSHRERGRRTPPDPERAAAAGRTDGDEQITGQEIDTRSVLVSRKDCPSICPVACSPSCCECPKLTADEAREDRLLRWNADVSAAVCAARARTVTP